MFGKIKKRNAAESEKSGLQNEEQSEAGCDPRGTTRGSEAGGDSLLLKQEASARFSLCLSVMRQSVK